MGTGLERNGAEAVTRDTVVTRETLEGFLLQAGLSAEEAQRIVASHGHKLFGHVGERRFANRQLRAVDVEAGLFNQGETVVADTIRANFGGVGAPKVEAEGVSEETMTDGISGRVSSVLDHIQETEEFTKDSVITRGNFVELVKWAGERDLSKEAAEALLFAIREISDKTGSLNLLFLARALPLLGFNGLSKRILDKLGGAEKE
ncbi:hypothetical protein M0P48_03795 [Candidatus Gracilibacteria bacterium]|jgi:hypothetical protein|nr:hypothetical protein [Candidatus Gracilibacteria bacterium]